MLILIKNNKEFLVNDLLKISNKGIRPVTFADCYQDNQNDKLIAREVVLTAKNELCT
jgi:hypothetical protein